MKKILVLFFILFVVFSANSIEVENNSFVYQYPIIVYKVIDGDTFDCDIDFGLGLHFEGQRVRLLGCDAYEKKGETRELGLKAKNIAEDFFTTGTFVLSTYGERDSFGRILGNARNEYGVYLKDVLIEERLTTGRYE